MNGKIEKLSLDLVDLALKDKCTYFELFLIEFNFLKFYLQ